MPAKDLPGTLIADRIVPMNPRGEPENPSGPGTGLIHMLLRARDWQDRPQFGRLCDWWRKGTAGVATLVGIGGAGKTAIAERFLRVLPGGLPEAEGIPKDPDLPPPYRRDTMLPCVVSARLSAFGGLRRDERAGT